MAELLAFSALETLRDRLVNEFGLSGVEDRTEDDVLRQLNMIHCFLKDVDGGKDRLDSESVQLCHSGLQDLAIEAEQVLQIYAVEVMARRERKDLKNSQKGFATILGERVKGQLINKAKYLFQKKKKKRKKAKMATNSDEERQQSVRKLARQLQDLAIEAEQVLEINEAEVMPRLNLLTSLKRFAWILGKCVSMRQIRKKAQGIISRMENLKPVAARKIKLMENLTKKTSPRKLGGQVERSRTNGDDVRGQVERSRTNEDDVRGQVELLRKITEIMSRLADLTKVLESFGVGEHQVELTRKTYDGHEVEEQFVGMKDTLKHLTSLVTSDEISTRVISICGMGGVGKTTLAKKIYEAKEVQRYFDAKAWICVAQELEPTQVFQQMLKQLLQKDIVEEDLSEDELYNILIEKKCLVVLDGVWSAQLWDTLSHRFLIAESSSKVLITTRSIDVAVAESIGCVFELRC